MASEHKIPAEPTRAEEISHLKHLVNSFASDPWLTIHPKLYQPSPYRMWYKAMFEYKHQYRMNFMKNFVMSAFLSSPLVIL